MAQLFISYAHEDQDAVRRIREALDAAGHDAWVDESGIRPSEDWMGSIHEALDRADAVLFGLSPASLDSEVCARELAYATDLNKRLIPIVLGDVSHEASPPHLRAADWDRVRSLHWIFLRPSDDFDAGIAALSEAINTDLELVRTHTRVLTRARAWEISGRRVSPLLRGDDLREAQAWLSRAATGIEPQPTELQRVFIEESRRREERRQRLAVVGSLAVAVMAIALSAFALVQRGQARHQARVARSRAIASAALDDFRIDNAQPDRGILLALEAQRQSPTSAARAAIITALGATDRIARFLPAESQVDAVASADAGRALVATTRTGAVDRWPLDGSGPKRTVLRVRNSVVRAISPNGRWIVTDSGSLRSIVVAARDLTHGGATRGTAQVPGNAPGGMAVTDGGLVGFGFTPVTAGARSEVVLFHGDTGEKVGRPVVAPPDTVVTGVAACADGSVVVASLSSGDVLVIDGRTGRQTGTLTRTDGVETAAGSVDVDPGGHRVAAGYKDSRTQIWTLDGHGSGQPAGRPPDRGRHLGVLSVRFDGDGARLAVGYADGVVQLWDSGSGALLRSLRVDRQRINALAFASGGTRIAIGSDDRHTILWNVSRHGSRDISPLGDQLPLGATQSVSDLAFDRKTGALVAGEGDGTVRTFDPVRRSAVGTPLRLGAALGTPVAVALDQDGTRLLTGTGTGTVQLWDRHDPAHPKPIGRPLLPGGGSSDVRGVAFSPDGRTAAAADRRVALIDLRTRHVQRLALPPGVKPSDPSAGTWSVAFDRSGRYLAVGDLGGTVELWHRNGSTWRRRMLPTAAGVFEVHTVAFSPDGRRLAGAQGNAAVAVWDVRSGRRLGELGQDVAGHLDQQIQDVAFSPDGRLIATADSLDELRLWDPATLRELGTPLPSGGGPGAFLNAVAISPDGRDVAVGGEAGTFVLWDRLLWHGNDISGQRARLCAIAGRNLTAEEWRVYVGNGSRRRTCPEWP